MRFKPKTAEEIATENLLPLGVYDFEVLEAEEATSAKGNDMIKLKLKVYEDDGGHRIVFDYLLEALAAKLRSAAEVCGLHPQYEAGELRATDFEGKVGKVKVGIQKDKAGQYPDRNAVLDYVFNKDPIAAEAKRGGGIGASKRAASAPLDDDIPFRAERIA